MTTNPVQIRRRTVEHTPTPGTAACGAPFGHLVLYPDGSARACCITNAVLGNVSDASLHDIWFGMRREDQAARLTRHDFSAGCEACGAELALEGRDGAYATSFDHLRPGPESGSRTRRYPASIYFNLSNVCNLQCAQCDGELSSAIRRHRERLPARRSPYGDDFFASLREFIPHLERAEFAGGEPFLAPETFQVLDLLAQLAPLVPCTVITNGTQWNRRVRAALRRHRFDVKLSLDGATPTTFESIRVGASFDEVVANVGRFIDYTRSVGTRFEISHCLMPANVHEFGALLRLADSWEVEVAVSVVRDPPEHSLVHLDPVELARIHGELLALDDEMTSELRLNRHVWRREVDRIGVWATGAGARLRGHDQHQVMWFARDGAGPVDPEVARREVAAASIDGAVFGLRIGPHQVITAVDGDPAPLTGRTGDELIGGHVRGLMAPLARRFGAIESMGDIEITHQDADRVDQLARFPTATLLIRTVPDRDLRGRADEAVMFVTRVDR